ncbi:glucose-1-phosphate adenylyltransferase [Paenibacillus mendelii]|uniref:Glucose-1-phosphate adenylyltransferase n=1 Tax=Paenibacillus mendelii TaxID=206163 RepID=A0ABV6J3W3_9BACL|nr:glucose-1-phosphate adenylyltransferase [Paenibacillus mendelii]MCQ6562034.1 glucose-1-phosphate adenylyltransferase [Paenibacillus mendelii]
MKSNECIAMLLAGGEGRRLAPLTAHLAKPAVPFGGRCRIVDYTLSNCVNSGIGTIGLLTQYKAESLHAHIGNGAPWHRKGSADRTSIALLPSSRIGREGYAGTADAIYQNIDYIDQHAPENVLILSGDHIYQMDYKELAKTHAESGAAATIAVKRVRWKEASRFGIMNTDQAGRITEFVEKPAKPQSNLASMGIYMFRWADLRAALIEDHEDPASSRDFGKDIIPRMLQQGESLVAHTFDGYWRDVGTVDSLWEAHMDLLDGEMQEAMEEWPVMTRERKQTLRSFVSRGADIQDSYVHPGCPVEGDLARSVLFGGVTVGRGSEIYESIVMPGARIGKNVKLNRAIIGEGAVIEDGAVVGSMDGEVSVVGAGERVAAHPRFSVSPLLLPQDIFEERETFSASTMTFEKV